MTLVELIKQLKEEFKAHGDRELAPSVTLESVLATPADVARDFHAMQTVARADQIGPADSAPPSPSTIRAPGRPPGPARKPAGSDNE